MGKWWWLSFVDWSSGRQNQPIADGVVVGRAKLVGQRDESEGRPAEGDN